MAKDNGSSSGTGSRSYSGKSGEGHRGLGSAGLTGHIGSCAGRSAGQPYSGRSGNENRYSTVKSNYAGDSRDIGRDPYSGRSAEGGRSEPYSGRGLPNIAATGFRNYFLREEDLYRR
jgi:hypothetical protein